jgi:hypothetical protein
MGETTFSWGYPYYQLFLLKGTWKVQYIINSTFLCVMGYEANFTEIFPNKSIESKLFQMLFFYHEMMTVLKAYHQSRRESYSHVL